MRVEDFLNRNCEGRWQLVAQIWTHRVKLVFCQYWSGNERDIPLQLFSVLTTHLITSNPINLIYESKLVDL